MPADPEKLRKPYIKKARNILRLTPEKQEKAKKKLKQGLERKKGQLDKVETELQMYLNRDEKALAAHSKALQKRAGEEGSSEEISDFRVPVPRSEFIKKGYDKLPPEKRPPVLRKDFTLDKWWEKQIEGHQDKLKDVKADHDNLHEDNRTLLELQLDDLESQKAIINPLKFENMEKHFGGKLVHKLENKEEKDIEKQVKSEKADIKTQVEKKVTALPENKGITKKELDKKIKAAQDLEINKRKRELHSAKLIEKNKMRFTQIREDELYRIEYNLKELQDEYKKLTGRKYKKAK
jgi:hypothetical protein